MNVPDHPALDATPAILDSPPPHAPAILPGGDPEAAPDPLAFGAKPGRVGAENDVAILCRVRLRGDHPALMCSEGGTQS